MTDYRLSENRVEYFNELYQLNLKHKVMPGLVYLYMPEIAARYEWDAEQRLWFAFLNGLTQNPITSLNLMSRLPIVPPTVAKLTVFTDWFNENWDVLQFDTDRKYQKKDTVEAIKAYARLVEEHKTQEAMLTGKSYKELWDLVRNNYVSFGRLSSFSYLEYVYLNGFGADCDDLLFDDKSGSRSHRNGMLFLLGQDQHVWDKRLDNGCKGEYDNFKNMCSYLKQEAKDYLRNFYTKRYPHQHVGNFTMESNLCTFKNHFFGRRYPGVYADMAQERIEWADERGLKHITSVFKDIRSNSLPEWLRSECEKERLPLKKKATIFPSTGRPYRAEYFITGEL